MIKNKDLQFKRQARRRSTTNRVIIHHSASHDVGAETIHRWHLDRGWLGIGYHFVIRKDGSIEAGRAEDTVGAHAGSGANGDSIGVCLTGNFEEHEPSAAQMESLARLIKEHIFKRYGEIVIEGHSDHMSTACPGRYFPLRKIKKGVRKEDDVVTEENLTWQQEQALEMVEKLAELGYLNDPGQHIETVKDVSDGRKVRDFVLITLLARLASEVETLKRGEIK